MLGSASLPHIFAAAAPFFPITLVKLHSCSLMINLRSHTAAASAADSTSGVDDGVSQLISVAVTISQSSQLHVQVQIKLAKSANTNLW